MFLTGKENPFEVFGRWYAEAQASIEKEPTAMVLSTASKNGTPSSRVILLKGFDERGFVFFTNRTSKKGRELKENPKAALCFYWNKLNKQVRINGDVEEVSDHESDQYHSSRRRGSQIGAWASKQSTELDDYSTLEKRVAEIEKQYEGADVPRPPYWGGFRVKPKTIEFWQEMEFRLHKRMVFTKTESGWSTKKLYP